MLALLPVGKISKIVRANPAWTALAAPPGIGDFIRALRWRRRFSQGQLAVALGVHRATAARWEEGQATPGEETRLRLCDLLGATPEERALLMASPSAAPLWNGIAPTLDACREEAIRLERGSGREADPLFDLRAYLLTGTLWNMATRAPEARLILAQTYAARAVYSCVRGDDTSALDYSGRSLDLIAAEAAPPKGTLYLALWASGHASAHRWAQSGAKQTLRQTKRWLLKMGTEKAPAFLLMNAAWWALQSGSLREARDYWQAANALAERSAAVSVHVREGLQSTYATLLVEEGHYEEGLEAGLRIQHESYHRPIMRHLFQTSVFLKMDARNDADSHLRRIYDLIVAEQADYYKQEADRYAAQLDG